MDPGGEEDEERPHLLAVPLDDVASDGVEQRHVRAHRLPKVGPKRLHFLGDGGLDVVDAGHESRQRYGLGAGWRVEARRYIWPFKPDSMIHSMTGYGKATTTVGPRRFTIELRSLNGKQLDLGIRMPSRLREREMVLRKDLAAALGRGKADLTISYETDAAEGRALNEPLIHGYLTALEKIAAERGYGAPGAGLLDVAMRLPDTVATSQEAFDEAEWNEVRQAISEAVSAFQDYRAQEGATLAADFEARVGRIAMLEEGLTPLLNARIDRVRDRIRNHLDEAIDRSRIDENRFEQEVLFYLEKMDVTEERVRLKAHCAYFLEMLGSAEAGQGKKLGFIAQEMGREINTLGSKANDAEIQRIVVGMKDELEKIKEQVLNVL